MGLRSVAQLTFTSCAANSLHLLYTTLWYSLTFLYSTFSVLPFFAPCSFSFPAFPKKNLPLPLCYFRRVVSLSFVLLKLVFLKGQCHEIFCFWFFSWISFPPAPEYPKFFRKFAEIFASKGAPPVSTTPVANVPPVSTTPLAICHRYQRHRRQICHRCHWHRW